MLNDENLVLNGKPQVADSDASNGKKQKMVVINEVAQTIDENRRNNDNNGDVIKKIPRQTKILEDDNFEIMPSINGNIISESNLHAQENEKTKIITEADHYSASLSENSTVGAKQTDSHKIQNNINNEFRSKSRGVVTLNSEASAKPSVADERLTERRKSFVPMSSMEEENLRERLRLAQLKRCNEIICKDSRYTKDTFRKLFQIEVSNLIFYCTKNHIGKFL